jgi:hypothetical protein
MTSLKNHPSLGAFQPPIFHMIVDAQKKLLDWARFPLLPVHSFTASPTTSPSNHSWLASKQFALKQMILSNQSKWTEGLKLNHIS